jgi:hypothetical protein
MLSNLSIKSHRPRPGLERARKDIPCGVLISVQNQSALHAAVRSYPQILRHLDATARALLTGPSRVHFHDFNTGAFSLVPRLGNDAGSPKGDSPLRPNLWIKWVAESAECSPKSLPISASG